MESLPHELLQYVSHQLLPRYQCRLALTSKRCYLYLYTDLLRWHARAASIEVPRCGYNSIAKLSVVKANRKLILYEHTEADGLRAYNLTTCKHTDIDITNQCLPMQSNGILGAIKLFITRILLTAAATLVI